MICLLPLTVTIKGITHSRSHWIPTASFLQTHSGARLSPINKAWCRHHLSMHPNFQGRMLQLFEHSLSFLASLLWCSFLILSSMLLWVNLLIWWSFQHLQSRFPLILLGRLQLKLLLLLKNLLRLLYRDYWLVNIFCRSRCKLNIDCCCGIFLCCLGNSCFSHCCFVYHLCCWR